MLEYIIFLIINVLHLLCTGDLNAFISRVSLNREVHIQYVGANNVKAVVNKPLIWMGYVAS
jgi:hypothetical protein